MRTKTLWLITLLAAALTTGLAYAHTLELPPKLGYGPDLYRDVQHTMYGFFAYVGAPIEVVAVLGGIALALTSRGTPLARWTVAGAALLAAGLATWAAVVQPANVAMARWTGETLPGTWEATRTQWELGHVAHFTVFGAGLVVLLLGLLRHTTLPAPRRTAPRRPSA
ncbi:hypothetical protein [Flindersiella endophytica]